MKIIKDSIKILNIKANLLVNEFELDNYKKKKYANGSIPYSMLSLFLQEQMKEKIRFDKLTNSYFSDLFVAVDFNCCHKEKQDDKKLYFTDGKTIEEKTGTYKVVMKSEELRTYLYKNGFNMVIDGKKEHFVFLERTAAKSRTGNAIFCSEKIFRTLNEYMLMGLDFTKAGKIDIPSLEVYKSLVCSSIIDFVDIDKNRICIVADEKLDFTDVCSVTSYSEEEEIKQEDKLYTVRNTIWDGEGIISSDIAPHNMVLLRNNFFKCCCLSTNIQDFKKKYNIEYFTDMFGNKIKNPLIITTPSSIKFFKFSYLFNSKKECWEYWKNHSDPHFGIIKYNKKGKFGSYGQLSYQVVNSLPSSYSDMLELMGDEIQYINNLKSENEIYFKLHINNNNQSYTDNFLNTMSNLDERFYKTKLYKKYKDSCIQQYIKELKCSHIKIKNLDYYTVFSLPQLLLKKAAGMDYSWDLDGNIGYCPAFTDDELFCWRNPHISTSNLCNFKNYMFDSDLQFFNLEEGNIVIINCKNNMPSQCGGMDFDSDTIGITNNKKLLELSKKPTQFKVPVLDIEPQKIELEYTLENIAICDNKISQQRIGEIVNLSALLLSYYYDIYHKDKTDERLKLLSDMINLLSNASMMEIDSAKKVYPEQARSKAILQFVREQCKDILEKEIIKVSKNKITDTEREEFETTGNKDILMKEKETYIKPNFFKFAQEEYKDQYSFRFFNCCSDYIVDILDNHKNRSKRIKPIPMDELLVKNKSYEKANRHQIQKIIDRIRAYKSEYVSLQHNNYLDELDKMNEREKIYSELLESIKKMNISSDTIYCILCRMFTEDKEKFLQAKNKKSATESLDFIRRNKILILNVLSFTHREEYVKCFKNMNTGTEHLVEDESGDIVIWGKKYRKEKL